MFIRFFDWIIDVQLFSSTLSVRVFSKFKRLTVKPRPLFMKNLIYNLSGNENVIQIA